MKLKTVQDRQSASQIIFNDINTRKKSGLAMSFVFSSHLSKKDIDLHQKRKAIRWTKGLK